MKLIFKKRQIRNLVSMGGDDRTDELFKCGSKDCIGWGCVNYNKKGVLKTHCGLNVGMCIFESCTDWKSDFLY